MTFTSRLLWQVLHECKETAAKRRRQSTRLENLGIPEEELLRQQQELFAKAREAAVQQEQQQLSISQTAAAQQAVQGQHHVSPQTSVSDDEDY